MGMILFEMRAQLSIFQDISCAHCGTVDQGSEGDKYPGFWDADTKQFCCNKCKEMHYQRKDLMAGMRGLYSEMPVMYGSAIYQ